jgi:hypothetical protein
MTPKEKALELYNSNIKLFKHYDANPKLNIGLHNYFKQSTLIAVDEIIKNQDNVVNMLRYKLILGGIKSIEMPSDYWNKVKQEIINL